MIKKMRFIICKEVLVMKIVISQYFRYTKEALVQVNNPHDSVLYKSMLFSTDPHHLLT